MGSKWVEATQPDFAVPVFPGVTLEKVQAVHKEGMERFKQSQAYQTGKDVLINVIQKQKNLNISSALMIGSGSFSSEDVAGSPEHVQGWTPYGTIPMTQLIAFECWVEILKEYYEELKTGEILFQDHEYNHIDKEFLKSLGGQCHVIDSPAHVFKIKKSTFLFTVATGNVAFSCLTVSEPSDLWITSDVAMMLIENNERFPKEDPEFSPKTQQKRIKAYLNDHVRLKWLDHTWPWNVPPDQIVKVSLGYHHIHYRPDDQATVPPIKEVLQERKEEYEKKKEPRLVWDESLDD